MRKREKNIPFSNQLHAHACSHETYREERIRQSSSNAVTACDRCMCIRDGNHARLALSSFKNFVKLLCVASVRCKFIIMP